MEEKNPFMETCFFCGRKFQFGEHEYAGNWLEEFRVHICNTCKDANWDGLAPVNEQKFLKHLEQNNLSKPDRNEKGLLLLS